MSQIAKRKSRVSGTIKDLYENRQFTIRAVFAIAFLTLIIKAAQLQLFDDTYRLKADAITIARQINYPARGLVYDRKGKLLLSNNNMYDILATYSQINPRMDTAKFCNLLHITKETFVANLNKDWKNIRFSKTVPFIFLRQISPEVCARLLENLYEFPGFEVELRSTRSYPQHAGAHVLGYISEVNEKQVETSEGIYENGDYIGSSGLELAYEKELRGKKGVELVLKDNMGRIVGPYKNGELDAVAQSGNDIISSIDIELQAFGESLMVNKRGSIVAIEPSSGEILSLISAPTYDPNILAIGPERGQAYLSLLQDPVKPFFDRTVMAQYPPGSIFKTVMSLVSMQEEVSGPFRTVGCHQGFYYGGRHYGCHAHPTANSVAEAIQYSCNAYYMQVFRDIVDKFGFNKPRQGFDILVNHLYDFGLGKKLGVDYPNEKNGNVPTSAFYDKVYRKELSGWKSPYIMSMGIGQGELQLTSLQMANLAVIMANRGWYYTPHLCKALRDEAGKKTINTAYATQHKVRVAPEYFNYVLNGMEAVMISGTGASASIPDIRICGKTGTSQNPHGDDHSVFFAFAPRDNPKIAIAVYVENAGWGASFAAPIATLMIEKFIRGYIPPERKYREENMRKASLLGTHQKKKARSANPTASTAQEADIPIDSIGQ